VASRQGAAVTAFGRRPGHGGAAWGSAFGHKAGKPWARCREEDVWRPGGGMAPTGGPRGRLFPKHKQTPKFKSIAGK
jgi:hypothetical protein